MRREISESLSYASPSWFLVTWQAIVWLFSASSVCLFACSPCGCTETPGPWPQCLDSLCSPHGCSPASCSHVACAWMGREGHILRSSQLQQLNRVQDWEVKGTCTRLLGELQSLVRDSVSGRHITGSCTPLRAHRLPQCGHLRHSGGQQHLCSILHGSSALWPCLLEFEWISVQGPLRCKSPSATLLPSRPGILHCCLW